MGVGFGRREPLCTRGLLSVYEQAPAPPRHTARLRLAPHTLHAIHVYLPCTVSNDLSCTASGALIGSCSRSKDA